MALVLRGQKAGPQPSQEKTDVTRNAKGTFFPALGRLAQSSLGCVRTPRRTLLAVRLRALLRPRESLVVLCRPSPPPPQTWPNVGRRRRGDRGWQWSEGSSGMQGGASCPRAPWPQCQVDSDASRLALSHSSITHLSPPQSPRPYSPLNAPLSPPNAPLSFPCCRSLTLMPPAAPSPCH